MSTCNIASQSALYVVVWITNTDQKKKRFAFVLSISFINMGVARIYEHQMETTEMTDDSLQLHPYSKWGLLLKERISSQREPILSFK